jgi:kynureninase
MKSDGVPLQKKSMIDPTLEYALEQDKSDVLAGFRDCFYIPCVNDTPSVYLCGNSLGLMPKQTREYVEQELEDWQKLGVEGHLHARTPWLPYHEFLSPSMAEVVGAMPSEVVVMNSLTVNLHLMMVSFYRPSGKRNKILLDYSPFPSDRYAVASQLRFHGYNPDSNLIELAPAAGSDYVSLESIQKILDEQGDEIALVLIGGVNYYTGQAYDIAAITHMCHASGCLVGFDLAHAAGNLLLSLHDDGPDFACWCTYKYLNSGPGSLSACFIHERHHGRSDLPRFEGWWGHDKQRRFLMEDRFMPIHTAEAWQLSNPPILSMAAIRSSLDLFAKAGMPALREKSVRLTGFLLRLLQELGEDTCRVITPLNVLERGCQVSIQMRRPDKRLFEFLSGEGVIADWREPDVIRVAPVPLYNTFEDVWRFYQIFRKGIETISA